MNAACWNPLPNGQVACTLCPVGCRLRPGQSPELEMGRHLTDVVAYANSAKQALLGVPEALLQEYGAVSEPVALAMAEGAARAAGATYGLSTTGIAGPGGGTPDKPVGTVFVAAVGSTWRECRRLQLPFERRGNKVVSAYAALDLLRRHCLAVGEPTEAHAVQ